MGKVISDEAIILSICITSYNRGELLQVNLRKMLKYEMNDIEFIVSDNASTDDTECLVKEISDDRLMYYRNSENIGFYKNGVLARSRGTGRYLLQLNERDYIQPQHLHKLVCWLRKNDGVDMCFMGWDLPNGMSHPVKGRDLTAEEGIYWMEKNRHPGMTIYRREAFAPIHRTELIRGSEQELIETRARFLFTYVPRFRIRICDCNINVIQPNVYVKKSIKQYREGITKDVYFAPESEYLLLEKRSRTILALNNRYKDTCLLACYKVRLMLGTFESYDSYQNPEIRKRYGVGDGSEINWIKVHLSFLCRYVRLLKKSGKTSCGLYRKLAWATAKNMAQFYKSRIW